MSEETPLPMSGGDYIGDYNPDDSEAVMNIKTTAIKLIDTFVYYCPEGRRRDLACNHIEEAAMLAVKSLYEVT